MIRFPMAVALSLFAIPLSAEQAKPTGPIPVVMEMRTDLPGFTVYRPVDPSKVKALSLGIVAWGNGGCHNLGNSAQELLTEIASHGYLVIAPGPIGKRPEPVPPPPLPPGVTPEQQLAEMVAKGEPAETQPEQLTQAIDWAIRANRGGIFKGRIDTKAIAVAGHSCGGLQAIAAGADRRVRTTVALNSGVFLQPRVQIDKSDLGKLHGPIAYFIGGPADIAWSNAEEDFAAITAVPVFKANSDFGHGGRLDEDNGGPVSPWLVKWLDWTTKHDRSARPAFAGSNCGMCRTLGWNVERKRLD